MKKNIFNISILALVGFAGILTSCRESFDYEDAYKTNPEYAFKVNFENAFGTIDPNQSWDFSTGAKKILTRSDEVKKPEIIDSNINDVKDVAQGQGNVVDNGTMNSYLYNAFDKAETNRYTALSEYGKYQAVLISNGRFGIAPAAHGNCENYVLVVRGYDETTDTEKIYTFDLAKINSTIAGNKGAKIGTGVVEHSDMANKYQGWELEFDDGWIITFELVDKLDEYGHSTRSSGDYFVFDGTIPALGTSHTPTVKDFGSIWSNFIAFEDYGTNDEDYNDLLFLTYNLKGEKDPDVVDPDDNKIPRTAVSGKRYMVEDLGNVETSDIDFNDIVFDMTETETYKLNVITHEITDRQRVKQSMVVRAMGGTKDISVMVGSPTATASFNKTSFGYDPDHMYNTGTPIEASTASFDPDCDFELEIETIDFEGFPWDPTTNNVYVEVEGDSHVDATITDSTPRRTISFPRNGEIPFMIAVDLDQKWNLEKRSVLEIFDSSSAITDANAHTFGYNLLLKQ